LWKISLADPHLVCSLDQWIYKEQNQSYD